MLLEPFRPIPPAPPEATPVPTNSIPELTQLLTNVQGLFKGLGLTIFLICVIVAGIMRMTSGGNERRVAMSNMAFTAAVIGLVMMLLAVAFQTFITGAI